MAADLRAASREAAIAAAGTSIPDALPFGHLQQTHPCYHGSYLKTLRALYEGGACLLRDGEVMQAVFPPHRDELVQVYQERVRRAFYTPHMAEILDYLVAALTDEPLRMATSDSTESGPSLSEDWEDFVEDTSPPGGQIVSLHSLVREQVRDALIDRVAWARVDLPRPSDSFVTRLDQEKAGALKPYVLAVPAASVIDWEEDAAGDLTWVLMRSAERRREGIGGSRGRTRLVWNYWDRVAWATYALEYDDKNPPVEQDTVPRVDGGDHTFGRVPFARLQLPMGLWLGNKLESLAREHLNKRSALSFGELQSLLPELYEFLGPEVIPGAVIGQAQQDPNRATRQRRGQGYVQERGKDDRAEFVGPPTSPFSEARASCAEIRDEMHRVTHVMALAVDNSASSLKRSGESKQQDKASTKVVLGALSHLALRHAEAICEMAARGVGASDVAGEWRASGLSNFDAVSLESSLAQAESVQLINIPSPTFKRIYAGKLARDILKDEATTEDFAAIEEELEQNITNEVEAPKAKTDLGSKELESDAEDATEEDEIDNAAE